MDHNVLKSTFPALPISTASFLTATLVLGGLIFAFTLHRRPIQEPFKRWIKQMIRSLIFALEWLIQVLRQMPLYRNKQGSLPRQHQRPGAMDTEDIEGRLPNSIVLTPIRSTALPTSH